MTITRKELLAIASEQMASMQSPGYMPSQDTIAKMASTARYCAERLIFEFGGTIEAPEVRRAYDPEARLDRREAGC